MESKYNRYISSKRKSLATLNEQGFANEGSLLWSSFSVPLVLLCVPLVTRRWTRIGALWATYVQVLKKLASWFYVPIFIECRTHVRLQKC